MFSLPSQVVLCLAKQQMQDYPAWLIQPRMRFVFLLSILPFLPLFCILEISKWTQEISGMRGENVLELFFCCCFFFFFLQNCFNCICWVITQTDMMFLHPLYLSYFLDMDQCYECKCVDTNYTVAFCVGWALHFNFLFSVISTRCNHKAFPWCVFMQYIVYNTPRWRKSLPKHPQKQ